MIEFLESSDALTVAFCQAGDFIGGVNGKRFGEKVIRKAMNTFFCRTDRPFQFVGTMNEDVTMYTTLGSRGALIMSITDCAIIQAATQGTKGGDVGSIRRRWNLPQVLLFRHVHAQRRQGGNAQFRA